MKKVLSGIQPTGDMHFGNYFGAVRNWVAMQEQYNCLYCVVDYHSITMPYDPIKLRENTWTMIFYVLACGVKPENLFIQSLVPEHTELGWILGCVTSYGQLSRMTQFKDKTAQLEEKGGDGFISAGLFTYPVLQAADILLYQADYVPVGIDQVQHLELTRNIAERFNGQFGKPFFTLPEPMLTDFPKIMSPADPTRKMSKSLGEKHYINLFAEEARIRKQIQSAVTDSGVASESMAPGVKNLFEMIRACGQMEAHTALMDSYNAGSLRYGDLKAATADALVAESAPIRERYQAILADKKHIKEQVKAASEQIRKRAQGTIKEVKDLTGLSNVKF